MPFIGLLYKKSKKGAVYAETSKINNSGWRIDYFLVSDRIKDKVVSSGMLDSGERQDHTPLSLEIEI